MAVVSRGEWGSYSAQSCVVPSAWPVGTGRRWLIPDQKGRVQGRGEFSDGGEEVTDPGSGLGRSRNGPGSRGGSPERRSGGQGGWAGGPGGRSPDPGGPGRGAGRRRSKWQTQGRWGPEDEDPGQSRGGVPGKSGGWSGRRHLRRRPRGARAVREVSAGRRGVCRKEAPGPGRGGGGDAVRRPVCGRRAGAGSRLALRWLRDVLPLAAPGAAGSHYLPPPASRAGGSRRPGRGAS